MSTRSAVGSRSPSQGGVMQRLARRVRATGWVLLAATAAQLGVSDSTEAKPRPQLAVLASLPPTPREDLRELPLRSPRLGRLQAQLHALVNSSTLRRLRVGVMVRDAYSGAELFSQSADSPFNPASNTKIITTAAALSVLGADFRYRTALLSPAAAAEAIGSREDGVLTGDLFVQGSGDPSLTPAGIEELARSLARLGVRRIEGDVRLDGQVRSLDELVASGGAAAAYGGGGLLLSRDSYTVRIEPGSAGGGASVRLEPASPYFVLHNRVRTVRGKRSRVSVDHSRRDDHLEVTVTGRIGTQRHRLSVRKKLVDSSAWAVATLHRALSDLGITVSGAVRVGPPPSGPLRVLAEHRSAPLSDICRVVNKDSNNFVAEVVWKTLGAARFGLPGTLEKGARAAAEWLAPMGIDPARVHLVNGSGLTYENRLRPRDLSQLLFQLYHDLDLGPELLQSLAVGGIDGTIKGRFRGGSVGLVRAKTGTLNSVSVLSGYVGTHPGALVFTIFVEGFRGRRLTAVRQAQARIVEELLRFVRSDEQLAPAVPSVPLVPAPPGPESPESPENKDDPDDEDAA
ncbi:MAG: D-alanyl-D-alanine carboxypeptidase/D-alanyl-D-alanine-endopeptidase [Polyangia bacterium]